MIRYRHPLSATFQHTEGVQKFAEQHNCFWLIDAIASWQYKNPVDNWFQVWKLEQVVGLGTSFWKLSGREDDGIPPFAEQEIEFSDFDQDKFECYVCAEGDLRVMLLKEEY